MTYDWEKTRRHKARLAAALAAADECFGDGLIVVGLAVANDHTGEAGLHLRSPYGDGYELVWHDMVQDIAHDAGTLHGEQIAASAEDWRRKQAGVAQ